MKNPDEKYIRECLKLASRGAGFVSPNPLVGCVIVKKGKVIGRGYHKEFGGAHAEVNAVEQAKAKGHSLNGSTVYVNLEPCSHSGKTGPCALMLANEKPARVVIGIKDPYGKVNGKGIEILRNAGIRTDVGVLEGQCRELNKFFLTYVQLKRPYITMKIAQSLDGKIALTNFDSKYITSLAARQVVHRMRSEYDAVLIGRNTALHDNPRLDARQVKGRPPFRIVIDKGLTLPDKLNIFTDELSDKTILLTSETGKKAMETYSVDSVSLKQKDGMFSISDILRSLYKRKISSILVEGGMTLFSQFLISGMYDEIVVFVSPRIVGAGISAFDNLLLNSINSSHELRLKNAAQIENELILRYEKCSQE